MSLVSFPLGPQCHFNTCCAVMTQTLAALRVADLFQSTQNLFSKTVLL